MEGFSSSKVKSNLERLLRSLTPVVPSKEIPLGCISSLNQKLEPVGKQISEYFTLGDLWDWFEKFSACGAGTKVELKNGDNVVQYFVPYLSAIQIFTTKSSKTVRSVREDLVLDDEEFDSGFCSDESDGGKLLSRSESKKSYSSGGDTSTDSTSESSSPTRNTRGNLYFMFHESCSPFWRIPLFDKITELAEEYPGILTLKSTDLSPASWVAVSWYPIYHIPAKGPIEDLSAAFLTFHTLSSVFQDDEDSDASDHEEDENSDVESRQPRSPSSITLRPFGVASFKLTGNIWFQNELDSAKMLNLQHAAASWLKQLDFEHHDFKFFTTNVEHVYYY